jgi:uncharacterized FlaG/YvyC family protein
MDISAIASVMLSPTGSASAGGTPVSAAPPPTGAAPPSETGNTPSSSAAKSVGNAPTKTSLAQAIKQVNNSFSKNGQNLSVSFGKDKQTGIDVITFTDMDTHQVISQIPSKAMIALAQSLSTNGKLGQGQLLSSTA